MSFYLSRHLTLLAALAVFSSGCKGLRPTDTRPLDEAGMWYRSIEELRALKVTEAEVAELVKVRQVGVSDATCTELLRIARARQQPFSGGDAIAGLKRVGVSEPNLLELARLNQLGLWVGEAQALRLTGLSDQVILALARRRAAGQPVPSGASLARLKNTGLGEAEILKFIERGLTEERAQQIVAERERALTRSSFIRYSRRRR